MAVIARFKTFVCIWQDTWRSLRPADLKHENTEILNHGTLGHPYHLDTEDTEHLTTSMGGSSESDGEWHHQDDRADVASSDVSSDESDHPKRDEIELERNLFRRHY